MSEKLRFFRASRRDAKRYPRHVVTGFRYRIEELRVAVTANTTRANRAAVAENAETRLKTVRFEHKRRKLFLG